MEVPGVGGVEQLHGLGLVAPVDLAHVILDALPLLQHAQRGGAQGGGGLGLRRVEAPQAGEGVGHGAGQDGQRAFLGLQQQRSHLHRGTGSVCVWV